MNFKKYQHVERFGATEVQLIELGKCHIFPKLDGTNTSVWLDENGNIAAGSRNRQLTDEEDHHGFLNWAQQNLNFRKFLDKNPGTRLYGEWLVPHSLKTYRETAWRKFYVFDVTFDMPDGHTGYIPYEMYAPDLEAFGIDYITPICTITNGSYEQFVNQLQKNVFLVEDGKGCGEGIVIKRYDFVNRSGSTVWAKIVTSEFKEKHAKEMGASDIKGAKMVEDEIAQEFVTLHMVDKEFDKIRNTYGGFGGKNIPQLLHTVFYTVVKEEAWEFIKKHKNPTINFKTLQHFVFQRVKQLRPDLF